MKNLTFFIVMLFSIALSAQNFPADKPEMLLNKEVKVLDKDSPKEYGYADFYKDKELDKVYACCQKYNAKYEKLVNRVFKVTAVEPVKGVKSRGGTMFLLTLQDAKETIYFNYNSKYESVFPFEVIGGLDIPADSYCKFIKEEESKTQPGKNFYISDKKEGISFFKMNTDGMDVYLVSMTVPSDKIVPVSKGASIELANSYSITMPDAKVEAIDNGAGGKAYSANISLTDKDIEILKANKIVKATVNGITINVQQGDTHKGIFNCIITKKTKSLCDVVKKNDQEDFYFYTAAVEDIAFIKSIEKADNAVSYKLKVTVQGATLKKDIKTATVMMENSKEISRTDAQVTVKPLANGKYEYSTYIDLTAEEVALLKNNKVQAGLISTFDTRITKGAMLKELVNCVDSKQ